MHTVGATAYEINPLGRVVENIKWSLLALSQSDEGKGSALVF